MRRNLNKTMATLLITTTVIAGLPQLQAQADGGRTNAPKQQLSWRNVFKRLSEVLTRKEPPVRSAVGGSRGDSSSDVCAIAPGPVTKTSVVWSDRPSFFWQGAAQEVKVRSHVSQDVLWSQPLTATNQRATYKLTYKGAAPLQPGQTYDWELVVAPSSSQNSGFKFQVMEVRERDRIATELTALEAALQIKGATAEEIALQRANYFAEHQLFSDALQAAYSVKNPSAELSSLIQAVPTEFCPKR